MKQIFFSLLLAVGLTACSNFGKKVSHDYLEVYYKDGITKEQAQKTLDFLYPLWQEKTGKTETKSIQLTKGDGDTINFRMVADKDKLKAIGDETFYLMANLFSDTLFYGSPVNMVFTDNKFKEFRSLVFKKTVPEEPNEGYGEKTLVGNIEVFAKGDIGSMLANQLAEMLNKEVSPATVISFQISKNDKNDFVIKMVTTQGNINELTNKDLADMCEKISNDVLNGAPLVFQLSDEHFNPLRTFSYPNDVNKPD